MTVLDSVRVVLAVLDGVRVVPDGVQLPFFLLGGIFSLGKYRAICYYFEMRRNIIIILLSEGTKYYYFIEKEDKMLLEGEILLFLRNSCVKMYVKNRVFL